MWSFIASLDFMSCVMLIQHGLIHQGGDKLCRIQRKILRKDCGFMADCFKTKGLHKFCSIYYSTEEVFKKGIEAEDSLITLAKNCCLSLNEVKILVNHLLKKKENHANAA